MASSILDSINYPDSLKNLSNEELDQLSIEIRKFIINTLSITGGHLGANLGIVELTLALHKVFNSPKDKIIWDIGHQSYVHKIVTGRKNMFSTLRQKNGISGFTNKNESIYDHFGAGHSSTSISAALGIAVAKKFLNDPSDVIAVIGDASIVSGMAFEGLNHAGSLEIPNLIVVLNDNNKSILDSVGALNIYLSKLMSSYSYSFIRENSKAIIDNIPFRMGKIIKDIEKYLRNITTNGFFEALGFFYIGPIDGHNFNHLIPVLNNIKINKHKTKPVLLHVITKKGKGYLPAENADDNLHGVGKFCIESGKVYISNNKSYSEVFAKQLYNLALNDKNIVVITAGTISGTGLYEFFKKFNERSFDVGISEQHAVTFAAGLSLDKFKPFVCLYSTFAQRAYDQIVHDVCLQKLPVRFILDRSGFVGEDGATHHGLLNYSIYLPLPNIVYMVPFTSEELTSMLEFMLELNDTPSFVSFPKGNILNRSEVSELFCNNLLLPNEIIEYGKGEILQLGKDIAVVAFGSLLKEVICASNRLINEGIFITIVNPRFLKPIDSNLFKDIISKHRFILTIEEGYGGGFFSEVYKFYQLHKELNPELNITSHWLEDKYFEHAKQSEQLKMAFLNKEGIYKKIKSIICKPE